MVAVGPSREPLPLKALRAALGGDAPFDGEDWLTSAQKENLIEEAAELLRSSGREGPGGSLAADLSRRIAPLAREARARRTALWQLDGNRTAIRITYTKGKPALGLDDGDIQGLFLQALRLEGLPLALDLGQRPRALLAAGLPLPAEALSDGETLDAVFKREPAGAVGDLVAALNQRLPPGLCASRWEPLPNHASPVAELALQAFWRWEVPLDLLPRVEAAVAAFQAAETWLWDRGGTRTEATLDLRRILSAWGWAGPSLSFSQRLGEHAALNPLKALGAVVGLDPAGLRGLRRTGVDLKPDPRLAKGDRYAPKLKNMYEDAVLLAGGSNITLVDDEDDEPLRLG